MFSGVPDSVVAGQALTVVGELLVPVATSTSSLIAYYRLVDGDGRVYASGVSPAITRTSTSDNQQDKLSFTATLTIPELIPASERGTRYQIQWSVVAPGFSGSCAESISVLPIIADTIGAQDSVEVRGDPIVLRAVLPANGGASVKVYYQNELLWTDSASLIGDSHSGYNFETAPVGVELLPYLEPYTVLWSQGGAHTEVSRLFVVTPALLDCLKEFNTFMNRLKRECRLEELTFPTTDLLAMLKAGGDKFNATGLYTDFNFTNAQGAIRYWWVVCAQIIALRTRFLEEAEASFDFSGQSVNLTVDITGHLDSLASNLESQLESQLVPLKRQLHKRGILAGDGSGVGFVARTRGAVGISVSPVSGRTSGTYGIGGGRGVVGIRR